MGLILLPFPRPLGPPRHRSGWRGPPLPDERRPIPTAAVAGPDPRRVSPRSFVRGHTEGTFGPDDRTSAGSGRFAPRPRTPSTPGNRAPGIRAAAGRCSASPPDGPIQRTGLQARGARPTTRVRRGRRGPTPALERCGPSHRCGDPCGPRVSRLGLLTYRAVHRRAADHSSAANAIFPCGRRGDWSYGPRHRRGYGSVSSGYVETGNRHGRRRRGRGGRGQRWYGDCSRSRRRRGVRTTRNGGGGVYLGQRVTALRTEERPLVRELSAVQTDRHARGQG